MLLLCQIPLPHMSCAELAKIFLFSFERTKIYRFLTLNKNADCYMKLTSIHKNRFNKIEPIFMLNTVIVFFLSFF
jgi:hypothetical protein